MTTPERIAAFLSTSALCLGLSAGAVYATPLVQAWQAQALAIDEVAQPERKPGQVGDQHQAGDDHADKGQ